MYEEEEEGQEEGQEMMAKRNIDAGQEREQEENRKGRDRTDKRRKGKDV